MAKKNPWMTRPSLTQHPDLLPNGVSTPKGVFSGARSFSPGAVLPDQSPNDLYRPNFTTRPAPTPEPVPFRGGLQPYRQPPTPRIQSGGPLRTIDVPSQPATDLVRSGPRPNWTPGTGQTSPRLLTGTPSAGSIPWNPYLLAATALQGSMNFADGLDAQSSERFGQQSYEDRIGRKAQKGDWALKPDGTWGRIGVDMPHPDDPGNLPAPGLMQSQLAAQAPRISPMVQPEHPDLPQANSFAAPYAAMQVAKRHNPEAISPPLDENQWAQDLRRQIAAIPPTGTSIHDPIIGPVNAAAPNTDRSAFESQNAQLQGNFDRATAMEGRFDPNAVAHASQPNLGILPYTSTVEPRSAWTPARLQAQADLSMENTLQKRPGGGGLTATGGWDARPAVARSQPVRSTYEMARQGITRGPQGQESQPDAARATLFNAHMNWRPANQATREAMVQSNAWNAQAARRGRMGVDEGIDPQQAETWVQGANANPWQVGAAWGQQPMMGTQQVLDAQVSAAGGKMTARSRAAALAAWTRGGGEASLGPFESFYNATMGGQGGSVVPKAPDPAPTTPKEPMGWGQTAAIGAGAAAAPWAYRKLVKPITSAWWNAGKAAAPAAADAAAASPSVGSAAGAVGRGILPWLPLAGAYGGVAAPLAASLLWADGFDKKQAAKAKETPYEKRIGRKAKRGDWYQDANGQWQRHMVTGNALE